MMKQNYLNSLKAALKALPEEEMQEIIADYSSYFEESLTNGRSYEDTAKALGSPQSLANEHLLEFYERTNQTFNPINRIKCFLLRSRMKKEASITITREVKWTSGNKMMIEIPLEVHWQKSDQTYAALEGPQNILEHVQIDSERLHGRFKWPFFKRNPIKLELMSPTIEKWELIGSGDLYLHEIDQSSLYLSLTGSGEIKASGSTENVTLHMEGTGDVDISELDQKNTTVNMIGSGDAFIAPTEKAILSITGHGDIKLLCKPKKITIQNNDKGDIKFANGSTVLAIE